LPVFRVSRAGIDLSNKVVNVARRECFIRHYRLPHRSAAERRPDLFIEIA
jgi:hypothetical protein